MRPAYPRFSRSIVVHARRQGCGRLFEKRAGSAVRREQLVEFRPQRSIAGAFAQEECRPLVRRKSSAA